MLSQVVLKKNRNLQAISHTKQQNKTLIKSQTLENKYSSVFFSILSIQKHCFFFAAVLSLLIDNYLMILEKEKYGFIR